MTCSLRPTLRRLAVVLCFFPLVLAGCSGSVLPTRAAPKEASVPGEEYKLESGNQVRVTVFNEPSLSGDFVVDPTGKLALPLVGNVPAAGLTATSLADRIAKQMIQSSLLRDPQISVEILTFRPVYVLGEVREPGEFPYTPGLTVLRAIARAGGYAYRARSDRVVLVRQEGGDEATYFAEEQTRLQPGDIVKVLERLY